MEEKGGKKEKGHKKEGKVGKEGKNEGHKKWQMTKSEKYKNGTRIRKFHIKGRRSRDIVTSEVIFYVSDLVSKDNTLQRHNTEILKQMLPEKELCGLTFNFHIHVSVADIQYIFPQSAACLFCCCCGPILGI
jgi:hypothetical protein